MFKRLLIANRGEIACRIIRTARRLGIETVAVFSDVDAEALHVRQADHAVCIGAAPATESYLNVAAIMQAAKSFQADALHPGYGFLSESPALVEACTEHGVTFIGPTADAMRQLGLKDEAKRIAVAAGVPIVPGYFGAATDPATLVREAKSIGYPLMVKAVAGGGGRGMRVVSKPGELAEALESAGREAGAAFGEARLMLEKLVESPRHIEVQVFGDQHGNAIHLFERDCTLQRRHQKVIEEAPAPGMSTDLRRKMTAAAVKLAKAVGYAGAGTVEFLVEGGELSADAPFYFIEMNTRLQVEHPVTEAITGLDLVEWQLRVAAGEPLPLEQDQVRHSGHAVELRLYAEDPAADFQPSVGTLQRFTLPDDDCLRVDTGLRQGDAVSPFYDPMIAKVISHAPDRPAALHALDNALEELVVLGVVTNASFLRALLRHADVHSGHLDTGLIARDFDSLTELLPQYRAEAVEAGLWALLKQQSSKTGNRSWDADDSFQLGPARHIARQVLVDGALQAVVLGVNAATLSQQFEIAVTDRRTAFVWCGLRQVELVLVDPGASEEAHVAGDGQTRAPITGRVASIEVTEGETIEEGATVFVVEAMKMEHVVRSDVSGTVEQVLVAVGDQVSSGDLIVAIRSAVGERI